MKFRFQSLPFQNGQRPIVPVEFPSLSNTAIPGLVDSGAWGTRVDASWAQELSIDLSQGERQEFTAANGAYVAYAVPVSLKIGRVTWVANVSFTEGWNRPFVLLGLNGFFEHFVVRIDASKAETTLTRR